jgi:hypothetical protein
MSRVVASSSASKHSSRVFDRSWPTLLDDFVQFRCYQLSASVAFD